MKEKLIEFKNKLLSFIKKHKKKFIIWASAITVALAIVIGCAVYVGNYYRVDNEAVAEFLSSEMKTAVLSTDGDGHIIATPSEIKAGLIFYPVGKVAAEAYVPLMVALAERGILCVLTPMPYNLAVLDVNAAKGVQDKFPEVESWYIGGHSLGGSMAASYLSDNTDDFDGLILLGSYSTKDVSDCRVITILGSEDEVTNMKKYEKYKVNIPLGCEEVLITGGNHAYFGMYGEQKGDGRATITPAEQIIRTAGRIAGFIAGN